MIHYMLLFSRHGKVRLQKWFTPYPAKEEAKITREIVTTVLQRKPKMCNILEWQDMKIIYKRYASLYFAVCVDPTDNELLTLEIVHRYVETLDKYFGNVCELDIVFNFDKAYYLLDELLIAGEIQESSRKIIVHTQKKIEQTENEDVSDTLKNVTLM